MDETVLPLAWSGPPERARRGCSLGNASCFVRADAEANVDGLWLAANNRWYCGELSLRLLRPGATCSEMRYAPIEQQAHYTDATGANWFRSLTLDAVEPLVILSLSGSGFLPGERVEIRCDWRIGGARSETHRAQPPPIDCERRWQRVEANDYWTRVQPCDDGGDEATLWTSAAPVTNTWTEPGRIRLTFQVEADKTGEVRFFVRGKVFAANALPFPRALRLHSDGISSGREEAVGKAFAWGIIGSQRVWHRFANGDWGFTNDPPGNTIVTRDTAWFLFGADHFARDWSHKLLETLRKHAVYPEGKIAEYVRIAPEGVTRDDYNLNINDATPLYILAAEHHLRCTGYRKFLQTLYPSVRNAAGWILKQRREEGLVWCDGKGTNVWGSCGWRNIIPGYRLTGAVTELNALCVAALRAAASLADQSGDKAHQARFAAGAAELDAAMTQLVDPNTGYFLLNREESGPNPQLAIDLALPALFQAGPEEARVRTLLRLVEDDFRHPKGLRTLSRDDPAYHPRFAWGLMGGSWPNATAWAAAALYPYRPERAYRLAEEIAFSLFPETWGLPGVSVPGQFPEWFDGDTGESCGMSLSPWMPATYVWLIAEGLTKKI